MICYKRKLFEITCIFVICLQIEKNRPDAMITVPACNVMLARTFVPIIGIRRLKIIFTLFPTENRQYVQYCDIIYTPSNACKSHSTSTLSAAFKIIKTSAERMKYFKCTVPSFFWYIFERNTFTLNGHFIILDYRQQNIQRRV